MSAGGAAVDALPSLSPVCRSAIVSIVDESAGQILPALKNPTGPQASASEREFAGSASSTAADCFRDATFLASLTRMVDPIEQASVNAERLTGYVAAGFVLLGLAFSLLLPAGRSQADMSDAEASGYASEG